MYNGLAAGHPLPATHASRHVAKAVIHSSMCIHIVQSRSLHPQDAAIRASRLDYHVFSNAAM